ncbi:FCD domain-containing protein [Zavarzinia compransoris]|uniref:FCD domain-containing protein n=1 Tax=Zavarzinia marina TaxID=2911065 RepID=UPI001F34FD26|nr:FCD domain-containing protein [Zavarzinia marina]MCF4165402.1 FCD domain-containing protein [Zavarzinia marina]
MSEEIKPPRLADQIAAHLRELILQGVLRPGDRLAPERELAEKLGVSRPSLRDAVDLLERSGLLVTSRAGTAVASFLAPLSEPIATLFEEDERVTADYFEFRLMMESQAARLAALRATDLDLAAIREQLTVLEAAHAEEDHGGEAAADVDLHMLIYEAAHNVVLLHMMRAIADLLRRGIFYSREQFYGRPGLRDAVMAQHRTIAEAVLARDPDRAEKAAVDHLRFIVGAIEDIRRDEGRRNASRRRVGRGDLIAG